jgi:hypothetical protein
LAQEIAAQNLCQGAVVTGTFAQHAHLPMPQENGGCRAKKRGDNES